MKKILLLIMIVTGISFAGFFEKSSDTTSHTQEVYRSGYEEYHSYVNEDPVEPTPTVVIWKRTAPDHCRNVNCKENRKYNHEPKHKKRQKRTIKVIRKE